MTESNEIKRYDCSRGCVVERTESGEVDCTYRQGCCKLEVYNWLQGVSQEQYKDLFEVRFKNTRKAIFRNGSGQSIKIGDMVIVEAANGHDLGIVTLEGPVVARQMKCKRIDPETFEFKRIYRKAKLFDIERWQEAIAREHETMIRSRQIAAELGLEMKIGDVEFQGDGTKAIFYYIADGRVDFRQLIKVFAEEFRIRIEMKQIGARQEAGLIGGLGVCGRELCCSNYISSFQSITTSAARCQDLSLNPQKLAGQCGKLKCCINYEASVYVDAQAKMPKVTEPLQFEDGEAFLMKTDILKGMMWFSYDPKSMANMIALGNKEVKEIIALNKKGVKAPSQMQNNLADKSSEFMSAAGEESISRFDNDNRKKRRQRNQEKPQHRKEKAERAENVDRQENVEKEGHKEHREHRERERNDRNRRNRGPRENREKKGKPQNNGNEA